MPANDGLHRCLVALPDEGMQQFGIATAIIGDRDETKEVDRRIRNGIAHTTTLPAEGEMRLEKLDLPDVFCTRAERPLPLKYNLPRPHLPAHKYAGGVEWIRS